jgi:hypothetical protein
MLKLTLSIGERKVFRKASEVNPMRRSLWLIFASLMLLILAGCGADPAAKRVQELRLSGQPDSARALALSLLNENANRMPLWLEFARASTEISRLNDNCEDPYIAECCMQAALMCAAVHQIQKTESRSWREVGRLVYAEAGRQLSSIMNTYSTQTQTAAALKSIKEQYQEQGLHYGETMRMEELVQSYRNDARRLLTSAVIWRRLLSVLPELNPGSSSMYGSELEQRQNEWIAALMLEPGYTNPIQKRAREQVDTALARLQEDINDLGYFLVRSVTENGVLP